MLVVLFAMTSFAQVSYQGRFIDINFGALVTATPESQYVDLTGWAKIDSISCSAYALGEVDMDSVDVYVGYGKGYFSTSALTFNVTINVAASTKVFEQLYVSGATVLTGAALRGVKSLKVTVAGDKDGGSEAGNIFHVLFHIWGTKL